MLLKAGNLLILILNFLVCKSEQYCNKGWEICPQTDECILKQCLQERNNVHQCGPGQLFCTVVNACVPACPVISARQISQSCPGELLFCFSQGKCSPPSSCKEDKENICDNGSVYCPSSGLCQTDTCFSLKGEASCPAGHIFCPSTSKCESSSMCTSLRPNNFSIICPKDYVYCYDAKECLPLEIGCGGQGTSILCRPGMAFCKSLGRCSSECAEGVQRWNPSSVCPSVYGEFNYTACFTSNDCVDTVCCNDFETDHSQCTNMDRKLGNDINNLCSSLQLTSTEIGEHCDELTACPPMFVCCNGTCKSQPRSVRSCYVGTLFCEATQTCMKTGSTCGKICPFSQIYCLISGSCTDINNCELDSYYTVPIMLAGPLIIINNTKTSNEIQLNTKLNAASDVTNTMTLKITDVWTAGGAFELKQDNSWVTIQTDDILLLKSTIRYTSSELNTFNYAYIKMDEVETGIERALVQLLAPPPQEQFMQEIKTLKSAEDEMLMVSLSELIKLNKENSEVQFKKSKNIQTMWTANENGLLDIGHSSTKDWVDLILQRNGLHLRGVSLEYVTTSSAQVDLLPFEVTADGGINWINLSEDKAVDIFLEKLEDFENILLKAYPLPNKYGIVSLLITPLFKTAEARKMPVAESLKMDFEILPLNDSPATKPFATPELLPSLISNTMLSVGSLASFFYVDPDSDDLGLVIVHAQKSDIGQWSYSTDNGASFVEISGFEENLLSEYITCPNHCQGVVNIRQNDDEIEKGLKRKPLQENIKINALFLRPKAILQYNQINADANLSKIASLMKTALLAFAWDGTSDVNQEVTVANISVPICANCELQDGLSSQPLYLHAEQKNCDGTSVVKNIKTKDDCSVCGGDGSSCLDCHGDIDGTAKFDECKLEECVGGNTGKVMAEKDCIEECGQNTEIFFLDEQLVCLPLNFTDITGVTCGEENSPMIKNSCGLCVDLNSAKNSRHDTCCGEECEQEKKSFTMCGKCMYYDEDVDEDCTSVDIYSPKVLDSAYERIANSGQESGVEATNERIQRTSFIGCFHFATTPPSCFLVTNSSEKKINITSFSEGRYFLFTPDYLENGEWKLSCSKDAGAITTSERSLYIYDSLQVQFEITSSENVIAGDEKDVEIKITGLNDVVLKHITCILNEDERYFESSIHISQNGSCFCRIPSTMAPGRINLGLLLDKSLLEFVKSGSLVLPTKRLTILPKSPKVISAKYYQNKDTLSIFFDTMIEINDGECASNFNPSSDISNDATCDVDGHTLNVFASSIDSTSKTVKLSGNNKIFQRGANKSPSNKAKGSANIEHIIQEDENSFQFSLTAPEVACNGTMVNAFVSYAETSLMPEVKAIWNVSWNPVAQNQQRHLQVWDSLSLIEESIRTSENKQEISFLSDYLVSGVQYVIVVHLEDMDGSRVSDLLTSTIEKMPTAEGFLVQIVGPRELIAYEKAIFRAEVIKCGEDETVMAERMEFFWEIEGVANKKLHVVDNLLIIPKNVLSAGKQYKIYLGAVTAIHSMSAEAEITVDVKKLGIKVMTATKHMVVGSEYSFFLDASSSMDLDNNPGNLLFSWSCEVASGPCITTALMRFENSIPSEDLKSPSFYVPPQILSPNTYTMTCKVHKGKEVATESVEVIVVPGSLPEIQVSGPSQPVLPDERIIIKGFISGDAGVSVWWTSDSPEISINSKSTVFQEKSRKRPYNLLLSPSTLRPNKIYNFQLQAKYYGLMDIASSDVIISTLTVPVLGTLTVTPRSGSALKTLFTYETKGWKLENEDMPITTYFGYKNDKSRPVWLKYSNKIEPTASLTLPAGGAQTKVTTMVKVCTSRGSCTELNGPRITVQNSQIDMKEAMDSIKTIEELDSVFAHIENVGKSITMPDDLKIFLRMTEFARSRLQTFIRSVIDEFETPKIANVIETGLDLYREMANEVESSSIFNKLIRDFVQLAKVTYAKSKGLPSAELSAIVPVTIGIPHSQWERIYFPTDQGELKVEHRRMERSLNVEKITRSHRLEPLKKGSAVSNSKKNRILTKDEITAFIKAHEELILSNSVDEYSKRNALNDLQESVTKYLSSLCLYIENSNEAINITTRLVGIIVRIYAQPIQKTLRYPVAISSEESFITIENYIKWGSILSQNSRLTSSCGEEESCPDVCLVTVEFNILFQSPTGISQPGQLKSHMIKSSIIRTQNRIELFPSKVARDSDYITYTLNLIGDSDNKTKCVTWSVNKWSEDDCKTDAFLNDANTNTINCKCRGTGFVTAYLKKDIQISTQETNLEDLDDSKTTIIPTSTIFVKKRVTFMLDSDYNETVLPDEEAFIDLLKVQLADIMNVSPEAIQNLTLISGSILVEFSLVEHYGQRIADSGASLEEITAILYEEIDNGLYFTGLNNEQLRAMSSNTVFVKRMDLPVLIGAILGVVTLLVLLLIFVALYMKSRNRKDKVHQLQTGHQTPTYRKINFAQSLDGMAPSFKKKSAQSFDDDIFTQRIITPESIDSGIGSPVWSSGKDVPPPCKYKPPSKKQLEMSGPIPDHIMKKIREELPGTPKN